MKARKIQSILSNLIPAVLLCITTFQAHAALLEFSFSSDIAHVDDGAVSSSNVALHSESSFILDTKAFDSSAFEFTQSSTDGLTYLHKFLLSGGVSDFSLSIEGVGEFTDSDLVAAIFDGDNIHTGDSSDPLQHFITFDLTSGASLLMLDGVIDPISLEQFLSSNDPIADMYLTSRGGGETTLLFLSGPLFIDFGQFYEVRKVSDVPEPTTMLLLLGALGTLYLMSTRRQI